MKLRKATIGVRHKGCWGSLCTLKFPNIIMKEKGPINIEKLKGEIMISATWEVNFKDKKEFEAFLKHLKTYGMIKKIKVISMNDTNALLKTVWISKKSSYDIVLKNNCLYTSPVTQKEGFEIYDVLTENPKELIKLIGDLEGIGEAKLFSVEKITPKNNGFKLTDKQANALQLAVSHDYYNWPRRINLEEISALCGMKRRTFQENLRKAEAKILPPLIKHFFEKKEE